MSDSPSPLRLRFETVGSIAAIVVGAAALWVSWDQGRVMRQEMRASVWPAIQIDGFTDTEGGGLRVGLTLENAGVGPALIERVSLHYGDTLIPDLDALREMVESDAPGFNVSYKTATGRILASGASIRPFEFEYPDPSDFPTNSDLAISGSAGRVTTDWTLEVCYCSSLGECWVTGTLNSTPAEIARCDLAPASDF